MLSFLTKDPTNRLKLHVLKAQEEEVFERRKKLRREAGLSNTRKARYVGMLNSFATFPKGKTSSDIKMMLQKQGEAIAKKSMAMEVINTVLEAVYNSQLINLSKIVHSRMSINMLSGV